LEYRTRTLKKYFLLTAFGKDRPGIVAGVTRVLFELGGSVEDASMTRLGGEFAMMLVTALPARSSPKLESSLRPLVKKFRLQIDAKRIPPQMARSGKRAEPRYLISVYGTDKPGIVYQVAKALAERQVSITDLNTRVLGPACRQAGRAGAPVYLMLLEVQIPPALDLDSLRAELDRLRSSLDVEISLQDIEAVAL
jgi:glycine cleavage system transcriptional repressor